MTWQSTIRDAQAEILSLRATQDELVAALAFYAAEGTWVNDIEEAAGAFVSRPYSSPADQDHGEMARALLERIKQ